MPVQMPGSAPRQPSPEDMPWNRDILVAPVVTLEPLSVGPSQIFLERSGVPNVIRDLKSPKKMIATFQWFPLDDQKKSSFDQVAIRVSTDGAKSWGAPWSPKILGLPEGYQRAFDPTLTQLEDGTYRLYFTSGTRPRFNPQEGAESSQHRGPSPGRGEHIGIYSATSSDLKVFTVEPGERTDRLDGPAVDCAVSKFGETTVMLAHLGPPKSPFERTQGYFATSRDGLRFERTLNALGPAQANFIGNLTKDKSDLLYIAQGRQGLWTMRSKDGRNWEQPIQSTIIGNDPVLVQDFDGKWWLYFVGPPRKDAVQGPRPAPASGPGFRQ